MRTLPSEGRVLPALALLVLGVLALASPAAAEAPPRLAMPEPDTDLRYVVLSFPAGSVADPAGREGLASLAATLVESKVQQRLQEAQTGARLHVVLDRERVTYFLKAHRDAFATAFATLAEGLASPPTDPASFEAARGRARNRVDGLLENAEALSRLALEEFIFRGHPYGRPLYGTRRSLEALTPVDLAAFHRQRYARDTVEVAVGGPDPEALLAAVTRGLEALPPGSAPTLDVPALVAEPRTKVLLVRQDVATTAAGLGFAVDFTRADPDFYALLPANSWLGQHRHMHGVLFRGLRETRGLNYGDYSYLEKFAEGRQDKMPWPRVPRRQQHFSVWIRNLADENAVFAARYALYQLQALVDRGLSEEDLALNRSFVVNNSKLWAFDPLQKLGYLLDARYYGTRPLLEEIETRTAGVTAEEVRRALKARMAGRGLRIVMVTRDPEAMRARLLGEADASPKYRTTIPPEEQAVDAEVLRMALPLEPGDVEIVEAEGML